MSSATKLLLVLSVVSIGLALTFGARKQEPKGVVLPEFPSELHGEWRTLNESFSDRGLVFGPDSFSLDLGEHGVEEHLLVELRTFEDAQSVWYVARYFSEGEESEMHFRYLAEYDEIRLRNRDEVWWKRADFVAQAREREAQEEERRRREQQARARTGS